MKTFKNICYICVEVFHSLSLGYVAGRRSDCDSP